MLSLVLVRKTNTKIMEITNPNTEVEADPIEENEDQAAETEEVAASDPDPDAGEEDISIPNTDDQEEI